MKLDKEVLTQILDGDHEGYELLGDEMTGTGRWHIDHTMYFKDLATNKCYEVDYSTGSTEQQEHYPFDYDGCECTEVHKVLKTIEVWEEVDA